MAIFKTIKTLTHRLGHYKNTGYTMIDMAISVSVLALLSVGAMELVQDNFDRTRLTNTTENAAKIEESLTNFAERFGYLPCPAKPDVVAGESGFGVATEYNSITKKCDDASLVSGAGAVPVRTLNLEDNVTYDGWGNKFTYRIAEYAGSSVDFKENTAFQSNITVSTLAGTALSHDSSRANDGTAYVLISHGHKAQHAAWGRNNTTPNPSAISVRGPGAKGEIGNATHRKAQYYQDVARGVFDDLVFFKRKSHLFSPKRMLAPIAMDKDICQSANMILKSGSPRDAGTPLNQFAQNNSGMEWLSRDIYTAANRMKAICDASPLEALAFTPPPNVVCLNASKFWHIPKSTCYDTEEEYCESGDEKFWYTDTCYDTEEEKCTVGQSGTWYSGQCYTTAEDLCLAQSKIWFNGQCYVPDSQPLCIAQANIWSNGNCYNNQESACDANQVNYNNDIGTNYYNNTCNYCPSNLTYRNGNNCYASAEAWCDATQANYNNDSGTNYYNNTCNFCPNNLTYRNGNNCYSNQQSYCNAISKPFLYKGTCYNNAGKKGACNNDNGFGAYLGTASNKSSNIYCCLNGSRTRNCPRVRGCSASYYCTQKFTFGIRCGSNIPGTSRKCGPRGSNTCWDTYSNSCYNEDGSWRP